MVAELLRAARGGHHERVISFGEQVLESLDSAADPSTYWLVQEAVCAAAHALDDYSFMERVATGMVNTAASLRRPDLRIGALLRVSTARRCQGDQESALAFARSALQDADALPKDSPLRAQLYQVLLAALVESGDPEEAWKFHRELAESLHLIPDEQEQGKVYWTLGNLAFLVGEAELGVQYHQQAATLLSPTENMLLWARFNRASTELRLQAGVLGPATHDCLKRAEVAFGLIEIGDLDRVGLCQTRSRWVAMNGDAGQALALLEDFDRNYRGAPEHLVPLLEWWAELLEANDQPELASRKREAAEATSREGA